MKKIIIGIHGLANKPPALQLSAWWLNSIEEGLARLGVEKQEIQFELVFWADILHPDLLDPEQTQPDGPGYIAEPYVIGIPTPKMTSRSFRARLFGYLDKQLDDIFLNEDQSLNLKGVTDQILQRYFSELSIYFQDDCVSASDPRCAARHHIQTRLSEILQKYRGYEILLISHSMGSIVAYDVLYDQPEDLKINTLVTIGSPLGLPFIMARELAIQRLKKPDLKRPAIPECIQNKWINLSDPEDKVAMDHALADDFSMNSHGVVIQDISIFNDYLIGGDRNPHKSFGYLRSEELATITYDFLTAQPKTGLKQRGLTWLRSMGSRLQFLWQK